MIEHLSNVASSWLNILFSTLVVVTCLVGDTVLQSKSNPGSLQPPKFLSEIESHPWFRPIVDSTTHGLVGGLSWAAVIMSPDNIHNVQQWAQVICAIVLASIIDVDHFMAARSWSIKAATSLDRRPILHSSTLLLLIIIMIWIVKKLIPGLERFDSIQVMLFVAWSSHHIRDAQRRGLWFPPFGSTPCIPYAVYLFIEFFSPLIVKCLIVGIENAKREKEIFASTHLPL